MGSTGLRREGDQVLAASYWTLCTDTAGNTRGQQSVILWVFVFLVAYASVEPMLNKLSDVPQSCLLSHGFPSLGVRAYC